MEFVCAIWNILTLDESNMGSMAFMIADPTGSKNLSCKLHLAIVLEALDCPHP
jgi:hypothetical protein